MDKGINQSFKNLTKALKYTREPIKQIRAVEATTIEGYIKDVAEVTYEDGHTKYADIGADSNLSALYDVMAMLVGIKPQSIGIKAIKPIEKPKSIIGAAVSAIFEGETDGE